MAANGGLITLEDLKAYKPVEREVLKGKYKDFDIMTAPPPSSGGIGLLQMLGVLEGSQYKESGWGAARRFTTSSRPCAATMPIEASISATRISRRFPFEP